MKQLLPVAKNYDMLCVVYHYMCFNYIAKNIREETCLSSAHIFAQMT